MLLLDIWHSLCDYESQQEMLRSRRNNPHQCWDCQQQSDWHQQNTCITKTGLMIVKYVYHYLVSGLLTPWLS